MEQEHGDEIRDRWEHEFDQLIGEIRAVDRAHELLAAVKDRGLSLVLASSGKQKHVDAYLDLLDGRRVADAWTTSDDVDDSKPAPDLLQVAIAKVSGTPAIKVGDSVWDCRAAAEAGVPAVGVLTGGFSRDELLDAGAAQVFTSLAKLESALDSVVEVVRA